MKLPRITALALVPLAAAVPACSEAGRGDPADMFHGLSSALEGGRPLAMLEMFPDRYYRDASSLVHTFSRRMDPEIWERGLGVVDKLARVVDEQRRLLLGHPMVAMATMGSEPEAVQAQLDFLSDALTAIAESDAATLEGLGRIDVKEFLVSTLTPALETLEPEQLREQGLTAVSALGLAWLAQPFTTTTEMHADGRATVSVHRAGAQTEPFEMLEVDGQWMLATSAAEWDQSFASARAEVEAFTITPEQKQEILAILQMADSTLDALLSAKTPDEFNAALGQAMQAASSFGGG
jgi:hypothetical protein